MSAMRAVLMARPESGAAEFIRDHPVPDPGKGEVRVQVANTAICGTDRHIFHWDDSIAGTMNTPVVIGHEFCGFIEELGEGVNGWAEGDYVSAEMHRVCGRCRACSAGNHHVCEKTEIVGLHADGAFAESVVVPAANLVRLDPEVVPPHVGAFLDALGNATHTVQAAGGIKGRHVMITGYGAIGAMAAAVVAFEGAASITITEVQPGHLTRARAWADGQDRDVPVHIYDAAQADLLAAVREETSGGVDCVLEMSGAPPAINLGLELLYPGGDIVLLGIPSASDLTLEEFSPRVIFKGLTMRGVVGRRMFSTWEKMLEMLAAGLDVEHIVTHRLPLEGFFDGIALLDAGEAHKVVLDPRMDGSAS